MVLSLLRGLTRPLRSHVAGCAPRVRAVSSAADAGMEDACRLQPGRLVIVALRDSAKAPRRLAVIKGPIMGGGGHILLQMDAQQEVAVLRKNIKMALPAPCADGTVGAETR